MKTSKRKSSSKVKGIESTCLRTSEKAIQDGWTVATDGIGYPHPVYVKDLDDVFRLVKTLLVEAETIYIHREVQP